MPTCEPPHMWANRVVDLEDNIFRQEDARARASTIARAPRAETGSLRSYKSKSRSRSSPRAESRNAPRAETGRASSRGNQGMLSRFSSLLVSSADKPGYTAHAPASTIARARPALRPRARAKAPLTSRARSPGLFD